MDKQLKNMITRRERIHNRHMRIRERDRETERETDRQTDRQAGGELVRFQKNEDWQKLPPKQ